MAELIADNFETGKATTIKLEDLSDEKLKLLVQTGSKAAISESLRRALNKG